MQTRSLWCKFANIWNLRDRAKPDYASASGPVSSGRTAHSASATTQRRRRPKKKTQSEQEKERDIQADPRTNKPSKVAKWAVSKATAVRVAGQNVKARAQVRRRPRWRSTRRGRAHQTRPLHIR